MTNFAPVVLSKEQSCCMSSRLSSCEGAGHRRCSAQHCGRPAAVRPFTAVKLCDRDHSAGKAMVLSKASAACRVSSRVCCATIGTFDLITLA